MDKQRQLALLENADGYIDKAYNLLVNFEELLEYRWDRMQGGEDEMDERVGATLKVVSNFVDGVARVRVCDLDLSWWEDGDEL